MAPAIMCFQLQKVFFKPQDVLKRKILQKRHLIQWAVFQYSDFQAYPGGELASFQLISKFLGKH